MTADDIHARQISQAQDAVNRAAKGMRELAALQLRTDASIRLLAEGRRALDAWGRIHRRATAFGPQRWTARQMRGAR